MGLGSTISQSHNTTKALSHLYLADEHQLLKNLVDIAQVDPPMRARIHQRASGLARVAREKAKRGQVIDTFLQEYGLSSAEGVTLMRLCEALIRTPDTPTAYLLMRDQINKGDWAEHIRGSQSPLVNLSTRGLQLSSGWISSTGGVRAKNLAAKLGDTVLHQAISQAMALMGQHFVLGKTIDQAIEKSAKGEKIGFAYSYDMLGEAAHTEADAQRYFESYLNAINKLAKSANQYSSLSEAPGISVKLSALHPRYEYAKREICVPALTARVKQLCLVAKNANIGLTIDAEEADRLETSLLITDNLMTDKDLSGWDGFGVVVQAYQRRATAVIKHLVTTAQNAERKITVRLVKGAYWDMEIKRAQELGLSSYPVFTRKEHTDVSFLACARLLFMAGDCVFPQFATHNAHSAAAMMEMAGDNRHYEFQRLHGMGQSLHIDLVQKSGVSSRVYAPVGQHKDLLPYLVRRLLENGANSSFVNQLIDPRFTIEEIIEDPIAESEENNFLQNPHIPAPRDLFEGARLSAKGIDPTQCLTAQDLEDRLHTAPKISATCLINGKAGPLDASHIIHNPATQEVVGAAVNGSIDDIDNAILSASQSKWGTTTSPEDRAACLKKAADLLEKNQDLFLQLCVLEAGKSFPDAIAELREAIDFCRYYANQTVSDPVRSRLPLGTVACISPWNFPLAIFLGQVVGALAVGNTVIAKPAEQTPLIAYEAVKLLYRAGIPEEALHLIIGDGATLGAYLVAQKEIAGICFTGSTATAKKIAASLSETDRPLIPFIAETGGINAMIVDSTALLEQAVSDVIASAFQSAGQRCSACRVVCIQDDVAEAFEKMLAGAMRLLDVGNPGILATDVGPVIDRLAHKDISTYVKDMKARFSIIEETRLPEDMPKGHFIAPIAISINSLQDLKREVFGPVLHIYRFKSDRLDQLIQDINNLGYGLTMGLHTRIDTRAERVAKLADIGNLYVNRNQIGAVVGVQPFGGDSLSGTGPKAGGPYYLKRLSKIKTTSQSALSTSTHIQQVKTPRKSSLLETAHTAFQEHIMLKRSEVFESALPELLPYFSNDTTPLLKSIQFAQDFIETETHLPGPTGEKNLYGLKGRGVLLCLGSEEHNILEQQTLLGLITGNTIVAVAKESQRDPFNGLITTLSKYGLPENLVQTVDETNLQNLLGGPIQGIIADGADRMALAHYLCHREGPILPLLSSKDDMERFCVERTRSTDTTAAGGNASLLAM